MRDLTKLEREFLEYIRDNHYKSKSYGYVNYQHKHTKKKYKRSRVLLQLHLNKRFDIWEHVHHKDGNKENDSLQNLELIDVSKHTSLTHAGSRGRKNKTRIKSNKLDEEIVEKIYELAKTCLRDGRPNCSKIGRELGIAGYTVQKYLEKVGKNARVA